MCVFKKIIYIALRTQCNTQQQKYSFDKQTSQKIDNAQIILNKEARRVLRDLKPVERTLCRGAVLIKNTNKEL